MLNKQTKSIYFQKLPQIVRLLKEGYHPEKIILFGSMLSADKDSRDIDLFLIKKTDEPRIGKRLLTASRYLPDAETPIDILVFTPREVDREIARGNVFISEILEKGRVLYNQDEN